MADWPDPWHPKAGGAELLTLRILERMARSGWKVEWFSARYNGAPAIEEREGITFVREGSQSSVHFRAFERYRKKSDDFDVVVDEVNTIPFYAHAYMKIPTIAFFCQLAQEVWRYEMPGVLGWAGSISEPIYLRPYRGRPIVTISESSAQTLREIGLRGPLSIIKMAVDEPADFVLPAKQIGRTIVYIGRLAPSKRVEHCIFAAKELAEHGWEGELVIAGTGAPSYVTSLKDLTRRIFGETSRVRFAGFISENERTQLLREASCLWMTSIREGWGLVVTEAARHGTPAVVYRVPGLTDAVRDGETGFVVDQNPQALAEATLKLWNSGFTLLADNALQASSRLNWNETAEGFESIITRYLKNRS